MTLGPVLDTAIGLIVVYLLLGIIGSGLKEAISGWMNLRGQSLRKGLEDLLAHDPSQDTAASDLFEKVFSHGLINPVQVTRDPSYIAARNFSTALIDTLAAGSQSVAFADLQSNIAALPDGRVKQTLSALAAQAGNDLDRFRDSVEHWFDDAMDRVSGTYKRFANNFLLIFGMVVAVAFNVSTVAIADALWTQPELRTKAADLAARLDQSLQVNAAAQSASAPARELTLGAAAGAASSPQQLGVAALAQFNQLALPIGWTGKAIDAIKASPLVYLAGWLITGLAVAMGAPFWFDLLGNVLKLRAAGPKPKRADET
jgi:hypothetical protein